MSNIIKSYTIRYESEIKMTIDHKNRDEELQAKRVNKLSQPELAEGFEEGLQAVLVDPIATDEEQRKSAWAIIDNANKEAADILEAARMEAQRITEVARKKAQDQGYEDGLNRGNKEIQQIKNNLMEQREIQNKEYQETLAGIEGHVAELMVSLITKLTGIFVEDKTDIILYLVEKTLLNDDSSENYTIRVSREDVEVLSSKKEYIEGVINREIHIVADSQLTKNQCLIETDNKVINCSLDVQLNNLITDLKLLSSI